ncbi:hypothetical protein DFH09DRAFT_1381104 [Mycena vulgaris]|nr:hypothetical protein DFH09DRAFT_1381104 [Mycena vulgaris]
MALNFRRISRGILSYRLGYSPQRPYPWRWTTPTVLCAFILLAAFLAALNVPLSAYEVIQEFTYRPNDTLPPLPFSNLIPEMLQHPTGGFTPQILTVGDTFNLNSSMFNWTITAAFDELQNSQPVSSFSYYNNPFSDGCDVTDMTIRLTPVSENSTGWHIQYTVDVTCHIPTLFTLTWNGGFSGMLGNTAEEDLSSLTVGLMAGFGNLILLSSFRSEALEGFEIAVQPSCEYGEVTVATSTELPTQAPCRLRPARLVFSYFYFEDYMFPGDDSYSEPLNTMFLNTFQSLYHLVRLELGLILENQIYASAEMYNHSIAPVYVPGLRLDSEVNGSLPYTSNADFMAGWKASVRSFQESDRVPVMLYLRSVPRLKPLGSAITSVFVSTFAMLSVLWTLFSLIAGALAGSYSDTRENPNEVSAVKSISGIGKSSEDCGSVMEDTEWDGSEASLFTPEKEDKVSQTRIEHLSLTGEKNNIRTSIAIAEIQLTLARVCLSLRKHGILVGSDDKNRKDMEDDLTDVQHQDSHPLLVQRSNRRATLDSLV